MVYYNIKFMSKQKLQNVKVPNCLEKYILKFLLKHDSILPISISN